MKPVLIAALASLVLAATPNHADAAGKGSKCPPGLAKKTPACVPPGLAKKGVTAVDRGYDIGDRIPDTEYVILAEGDRVIFDGREYVVVDTDNGTVLRRGDDWIIRCLAPKAQYWKRGEPFHLYHRDTNKYLGTTKSVEFTRDNCGSGCPIMGQLEAFGRGTNDKYTIFKVEQGIHLSV